MKVVFPGMTNADRQRRYRERNGARVGQSPGPLPSAPCGTVSAYKRHRRKGEDVDTACAEAWATYQRERYLARKSSSAGPGEHDPTKPT